MYRGLIHFHSNYSYDSILKINEVVSFAINKNLNFLILTDHDTIDGSIALKQYIENKQLDIEVLIAAEYNTEYGDIIALNIDSEIINMKFDSFIKEVKEQDGILLFPHPYKEHKKIEKIAEKVDMIEVFNARTDDISNIKALDLVTKYDKPFYYATDAHNYKSLDKAIVKFKKQGSFVKSLLKSNIVIENQGKSYLWEIYFSQYIKAFKYKNFRLFLILIVRTIKNFVNLNIFRKI